MTSPIRIEARAPGRSAANMPASVTRKLSAKFAEEMAPKLVSKMARNMRRNMTGKMPGNRVRHTPINAALNTAKNLARNLARNTAAQSTRAALLGLLICATVIFVQQPVFAQAAPDPERTAQALARAQTLLQQLGQQKTQLEVEVNKMRVEVAKTEKSLKAAKAKIESLEVALAEQEQVSARLDRNLNATQSRLETRNAELAEMTRKFIEKSKDFEALGNVKQRVDQTLAETEAELKTSEYNNVQLYQLNEELMGLLADKSWYEMMLQKDPITGLMDARIQSILEDYAARQYEFLNPENAAMLDVEAAELEGPAE